MTAGPATLGVRPEFVACADDGPIRGTVVIDEYLGAARCVHVDAPFGRVIARTADAGSRPAGSPVAISFAAGHVRLFDTGSGRRI